MKVVCIKEFDNFVVGKSYEYYTNFGGANHFVVEENGSKYPFKGESDYPIGKDVRPNIFEYFCLLEDHRENQINKIIG